MERASGGQMDLSWQSSELSQVVAVWLVLTALLFLIALPMYLNHLRLHRRLSMRPTGAQRSKRQRCENPLGLAFKDLSYWAPGGKQILHSVTGFMNPGELVAIMGPSGAGKTTLLDVLSGRGREGHSSGRVYVNGKRRTAAVRRQFQTRSGYMLQLARAFSSELTVRENLAYAALLRLPASMTLEGRMGRVDNVIDELDLNAIADVRVGSAMGGGISGGEERKLMLAIEMLTQPSVLFLDEPTSGLDATSAMDVMHSLRVLAQSGRTVVLTIHQPRASAFAAFDRLLLLYKGGVAFNGPPLAGHKFLKRLGHCLSPDDLEATDADIEQNPADVVLDLLSKRGVASGAGRKPPARKNRAPFLLSRMGRLSPRRTPPLRSLRTSSAPGRLALRRVVASPLLGPSRRVASPAHAEGPEPAKQELGLPSKKTPPTQFALNSHSPTAKARAALAAKVGPEALATVGERKVQVVESPRAGKVQVLETLQRHGVRTPATDPAVAAGEYPRGGAESWGQCYMDTLSASGHPLPIGSLAPRDLGEFAVALYQASGAEASIAEAIDECVAAAAEANDPLSRRDGGSSSLRDACATPWVRIWALHSRLLRTTGVGGYLTTAFQHTLAGLLVGSLFVYGSTKNVHTVCGAIFNMILAASAPLIATVPGTFCTQLDTLYKYEQPAGAVRPWEFLLHQLIFLTIQMLPSMFCMALPVYFLTFQPADSARTLYTFATLIFQVQDWIAVLLLISSTCWLLGLRGMLLPSVLAGLLHGLWLMASGFYIRPDEYPIYWEWVRLTNPFYRSMSSAMVINLEQLEIALEPGGEQLAGGGGFGGEVDGGRSLSLAGGGFLNQSALLSSGDEELTLRGFDGVSVSNNVWLMLITWLICVSLSFVALELEALHLQRAFYRPRAAASCLGGGLAANAGGSNHGDPGQAAQASTREVVEELRASRSSSGKAIRDLAEHANGAMAEEGAIKIFRSPSVSGFGFVAKHGSEGAETPTESHRRARRFFVARRQLLTRELAKEPKKPRPPTQVSPGSGRPDRPARRPASLSHVERTSQNSPKLGRD